MIRNVVYIIDRVGLHQRQVAECRAVLQEADGVIIDADLAATYHKESFVVRKNG